MSAAALARTETAKACQAQHVSSTPMISATAMCSATTGAREASHTATTSSPRGCAFTDGTPVGVCCLRLRAPDRRYHCAADPAQIMARGRFSDRSDRSPSGLCRNAYATAMSEMDSLELGIPRRTGFVAQQLQNREMSPHENRTFWRICFAEFPGGRWTRFGPLFGTECRTGRPFVSIENRRTRHPDEFLPARRSRTTGQNQGPALKDWSLEAFCRHSGPHCNGSASMRKATNPSPLPASDLGAHAAAVNEAWKGKAARRLRGSL